MQEDKFELNISSSETVDSLLRKIEAANGLALEGQHTVLIDGQPLASGMPLASYISKERATKLELVPCEPDADALPDNSPSLHSPGHLLHQHWQVSTGLGQKALGQEAQALTAAGAANMENLATVQQMLRTNHTCLIAYCCL